MSPSRSDIVIVGSGNVGFHVGQKLHQSGFRIRQVFSRTPEHGRSLAEKVNCSYTTDLSEIISDADVYLICVKDDVMREVVDALKIENKIVLHTAGSVPRNISNRTDIHQGVLYPLQSFNRNQEVKWMNVPVFVDGDVEAIRAATQIGQALSNNVQRANDEQRMSIHIAAVFANNFSNHCLAIGQRLLEEHGFDFSVLQPLVETTFSRLQSTRPFDVQTGPAIRGDGNTMTRHLIMLKKHPEWMELYRKLSDDIRKVHEVS